MTKNNKATATHAFFIAALCLFSLFVHWNWFQEGIHVYGEGGYFDKELIESFLSLPQLWQGRMDGGGSNIIELSKHPVRVAWGLLVQVFSPEKATFVLFGLPCIFLPVFTMYWFTQALFKRPAISFVAAYLFSFNTYVLTLQQGGQTGECIAILLLPIPALFFIKTIDKQRIQDALYGGLFFALVLCFDVRFAYLLGWACVLYLLITLPGNIRGESSTGTKNKWFQQIVLAGTFFLVPIAIHSYWIVPLLMHSGMPTFGNYNQPSWVAALSYMTIRHSVAFYHPFWGSFPDYKTMEVMAIYFIIPLFVLLGIVLHLNNKKIWYLALIALIGIILTKGSNPPFTDLYQWLFLHMPGFSAFRDPSKMYALIALAYSPLFGLGVIGLSDKIYEIRPGYKYPYIAVILLASVMLVFPGMKDQLKGGTFEPRPVPQEYKETRNFLIQHAKGYHTLYYPRGGKFSFCSEEYPYYGTPTVFNPFDQFFYRIEWNVNCLQQTTSLGTILGVLNIKYIVLNSGYPATTMDGLNRLRIQLLKQNGISEIPNHYILENKRVLPRFRMANDITLVVGGLGGTLVLIRGNADFFRGHSVVNLETVKSDELLDVLSQAKDILFYGQQWNDLVLGTLAAEYGIDLWPHADFSGQNALNTTWIRTTLPPHGNMAVNHGDLAYARPGVLECNLGSANLKTPFSVNKDGVYEVWLRPAYGPIMGSTRITVDKYEPVERFQKEEHKHFRWTRFGQYILKQGVHQLEIEAVGNGQHVLDQALVVEKTTRINTMTVLFQAIKDKPVLVQDKDQLIRTSLNPDILSNINNGDLHENARWYNSSDEEGNIINNQSESATEPGETPQEEIEWVKVSPTEYKIKLSGKKPGTLIFSESFDPGWVLKCGEEVVSYSRLINGRLNGFEIKGLEQGEYIVEYEPQRLVEIGLLVSALSLMGLIVLLINKAYYRRKII